MIAFIADCGFCVLFYSIQALISSVKLIVNNESDKNFTNLSTLICHCLIVIIHSFILVSVVSAYTVIEHYVPNFKASTFHVDYYSKIERSRCNLNEGYECPSPLAVVLNQLKRHQDATANRVATPQNDRYAGAGCSRLSSFKRTTDVDVHQEPRPMILYDEIQIKRRNNYDDPESFN